MQPHESGNLGQRFLFSIAVTVAILIAEVVGGLWVGSLALLSDAAHVFMDIFALALSYLALRLSALPADDRHTYGYHRFEVLAAFANGATLFVVAGGIFMEALRRWQTPEPVKSMEMLVIAVIGLVANLVVAFVLGGHHDEHEAEHGQQDLNVHSAFLHVIGDAVSSVGVILAALIIWGTGWIWVDPLISILIGFIILISSWRVLRSSLHILIEGAPEGVSVDDVGEVMVSTSGVGGVHDLHVWSLCSGHPALSAHVVIGDQTLVQTQAIMDELKSRLQTRFGVEHTTIQFECTSCGQGRVICAQE